MLAGVEANEHTYDTTLSKQEANTQTKNENAVVKNERLPHWTRRQENHFESRPYINVVELNGANALRGRGRGRDCNGGRDGRLQISCANNMTKWAAVRLRKYINIYTYKCIYICIGLVASAAPLAFAIPTPPFSSSSL